MGNGLMSRFLASIICGLAIVLALSAGAESSATQLEREDRQGLEGRPAEDYWESFIELRLGNNKRVDVQGIILLDAANAILAFPLDNAVFGDNADRVPGLGNLPLIGSLFGDRPKRSGLTPDQAIGAAYLSGKTLVVKLGDRPAPGPEAIGNEAVENEKALSELPGQILESGQRSPMAETEIALPDNASLRLGGLRVANRDMIFDVRSDYVARQPARSGKVPLLATQFGTRAGDAFRDRDRLLILIKPTVLLNNDR